MQDIHANKTALDHKAFLNMVGAHYVQVRTSNERMLSTCATQLQQLVPTVCKLTWDNAAHYNDEGYSDSIESITLHLQDAQGNKTTLELGDQSDIENCEYEYLPCLKSLIEEINEQDDEASLDDDALMDSTAKLFGIRNNLLKITSMSDIHHLFDVVTSTTELAILIDSGNHFIDSHYFDAINPLSVNELVEAIL